MGKLVTSLLTVLVRAEFVGGFVERILVACRRVMVEAMKRGRKTVVRPRNWSNEELKKFASVYTGDVVNVSAWRDEDKTGGRYRDYFAGASSYFITNYYGEKGLQHAENEILLDLEADIPAELNERFQVVFNHTTIEHVYDIRKAVKTLCALSSDTVIIVTPFLQQVHFEGGSFGDYWRPTPSCMERMLEENGFKTIYQSCNDNEWYIVYVFTVATRNPDQYQGRIPFGKIGSCAGNIHFGIDD